MNPQPPTGEPLWAIKAGSTAIGIDYEREEAILENGERCSFIALQTAAERDLAEFGHVKMNDGEEVDVARQQNGNDDREQLWEARRRAVDPDSASNGRFSGEPFGHVAMDGKVHPATPAQTTPPACRIASDRRSKVAVPARSP